MDQAWSHRQFLLVDQDPQQFDDRHGRMGVVQVDRHLVGKIVPGILRVLAVAADDVAQRAGNEEILLDQAQFLPVVGLVIRVKDLGDRLAHHLFAHRLDIASAVEGGEVEFLGRLRGPQAQEIHRWGAVAGDRRVKGHAQDGSRVDPARTGITAIVELVHDFAVKLHADRVFGPDDFPGIAEHDPVVRMLHLVPVDELLLEQAEFIVNAVADRGIIVGGQRIQEAGREAS